MRINKLVIVILVGMVSIFSSSCLTEESSDTIQSELVNVYFGYVWLERHSPAYATIDGEDYTFASFSKDIKENLPALLSLGEHKIKRATYDRYGNPIPHSVTIDVDKDGDEFVLDHHDILTKIN